MKRFKDLKRTGYLFLLALSYGFLSYNFFGGWWNSAAGTLLILFFSYVIWGRDFLRHTGMKLSARQVIFSFILLCLVIIGSGTIVRYISSRNQVMVSMSNWRNYFHIAFYTLNEEIVIGAILLFYLTRNLKIRPYPAIIGLAILFALVHFVFYRWVFNDRGIIGVLTLTTLFFVGFVRNSLILYTGHIGYSWALHFGWIFVMFGSFHEYSGTALRVSEPARFNLYLGSIEMLIISGVLAVITLVFSMRKFPGKF